MKTETKRTPGPWTTGIRQEGGRGFAVREIRAADGECIADIRGIDSGINAANAAYIVRACNSHDELVAALRYMVEALEMYATPEEIEQTSRVEYAMARAALQRAGE